MAFGNPIDLPINATGKRPEAAAVDAVHGDLLRGFQEIFDTHKQAYGWAHDKELEMV